MKVLVVAHPGSLCRALTRGLPKYGHEVVPFPASGDPASLLGEVQGSCSGMDAVVCTLGFTNEPHPQRRALWEAGATLLEDAARAGVRRFVHISRTSWALPPVGPRAHNAPGSCSDERAFEEKLKSSNLSASIIQTSALFADLLPMLGMARRGFVLRFGRGQNRLTPVHEDDVVDATAAALSSDVGAISVGGPEDLTWNQIFEMCFKAAHKPARTVRVPTLLMNGVLWMFRRILPPGSVMCRRLASAHRRDLLAPRVGTRGLQAFLDEHAEPS